MGLAEGRRAWSMSDLTWTITVWCVICITNNDEERTSFTPVGNEADLMQRREHLTAHTI